MKITKTRLKQVIKEELSRFYEGWPDHSEEVFLDDDEMVVEDERFMQKASEDIEDDGHEGIFHDWCKDHGHAGVNQACVDAAYRAGKPWKARAALAVTFSRAKGGQKSLRYPKSKD